MTRPDAKTLERRVLQELVRQLGLEDTLREVIPREAPDFELRLEGARAIGVEVTELADRTLAAGGAAIDRLESALTERLRNERLDVALQLSIPEGFADLLGDGKALRSHVDGIAALVREHVRSKRRKHLYRHRDLLKCGIQFVTRLGIREGSGVLIGESATGRRASFVQRCIDAKNAKIASYRANLPEREVWLALLSGMGLKSAVWSVVLEDHQYVSAFDRTFCVDAYEGYRLIELTCTAPPDGE